MHWNRPNCPILTNTIKVKSPRFYGPPFMLIMQVMHELFGPFLARFSGRMRGNYKHPK